ncbi:hypothetical protein B0H34DRAFT_792623 [Crassisporium funariophilum]|nr:hypothetical protein B0H34DRAFT_792623 [Crassisporium funariophilum]
MSEIDHIFASKGKAKDSIPSRNAPPLPKKSRSKKNKQKDISSPTIIVAAAKDEPPVASSSKKRPLPETVVDTSARLAAPSKRHKGEPAREEASNLKSSKSAKHFAKKNADFQDSRGTSDRRKTEEGWSVYKEDELGIGDQGGDTPLCPFDCECFVRIGF